jgi:DNA-binding CsgD family transcriptional regulator
LAAWTEGYRYFVGTRAFDDGQYSGWTSLDWSRRNGHAQRAEIELFRQLVPHIAGALQLSLRSGSLLKHAAISEFLLDRVPYGVTFLDGEGRPVIMNRAAETTLARRDGLLLADGEFRAANQTDTDKLRDFIFGAIRAGRGDGSGSGGAITLPRPSGNRPYAVLVAPFPRTANAFNRLGIAAVVFITDPDLSEEGPKEALMRLYGLTAREAALAARLATEMNLDRAADELGISRNTVRLHLQRVFDKTETHTQ